MCCCKINSPLSANIQNNKLLHRLHGNVTQILFRVSSTKSLINHISCIALNVVCVGGKIYINLSVCFKNRFSYFFSKQTTYDTKPIVKHIFSSYIFMRCVEHINHISKQIICNGAASSSSAVLSKSAVTHITPPKKKHGKVYHSYATHTSKVIQVYILTYVSQLKPAFKCFQKGILYTETIKECAPI